MTDKDHLDAMIEGAAAALDLKIEPASMLSVRANLAVSLRLGKMVAEFELPDDAEPAPIFRA